MNYISLYPPEISAAVAEFIKKQLRLHLEDHYTHMFFAPSLADAEVVIRGGDNVSCMSLKSPFSDVRSSLRQVSISGHHSEDLGYTIMKSLLGEPVPDSLIGPTLHIHLASYKPGESEQGPISGEEQKDVTSLFTLIEPAVKMDDLILPAGVKKRIIRNLVILKNNQMLFSEWGLGEIAGFRNSLSVSLNFIGPSGTGKTLAAEAVAYQLQRPLIVVDYSGLESKYVGDTSKNIKAVFGEASKREALLFFDEADSFLGKRVEDVQQSFDTAVNNTRSVMLMELNRFSGIIIFATNLVSNYDPAFRRRILDHIEFPLPDAKARAAILDRHTPARLPGRERLDFNSLAAAAEGLSGSDLANAVYKSCITLLERVDSGQGPATISNDDYLAALNEIKRSYELIKDSPESFVVAEEADETSGEENTAAEEGSPGESDR